MLFVYICSIAILCLVLYLLFRDTMNRLQMIEVLRVYWITKNNGVLTDPYVTKAFMRQTSYPFWRGTGIQARLGTYTFQIGVLVNKSESLLDQLDGRYLEESPKEIRSWQ